MAYPQVLALTGNKGCGKSMLADQIVNLLHYRKIGFAHPLKDMLMAMGLSQRQVNGDQKEIPSPLLCGRTPRHAMQTLGTEWGRNLIGPDLWVNAWKHKVQNLVGIQQVVVDDCRFDNEIAAIRALGGKIIRINRPGYKGDSHVSEQVPLYADFEVDNDSTISHLVGTVLLKLKVWSNATAA